MKQQSQHDEVKQKKKQKQKQQPNYVKKLKNSFNSETTKIVAQ